MIGDDNRDGDKPETSNTTPPVPPPTQPIPHTVLSIKLSILKRGEYDIWVMKMEHYLSHTDYPIWQVIQNGNGPVSITTDTNGMIKVLPPKTAEEVVARDRERKVRTSLLMALPEDHLKKFHKMADAKEMWKAIKSRFGGNDESKKMQKYLLKQRFKGFSVSALEGLHKGYDRFQTILSQLEIYDAGVLHEDTNQKFLRSLPSSWSQVDLIMRTNPGLDTLSFDYLYNNLRVFERDVKGTPASSSSNTQNVAFVSADNTDGTNDINNDDMKEIDLKWQVAMISMRIKKFHKRTETAELKGIKTIEEEMLEDIDWSGHVEEDVQNFAMMTYSSRNSGSDNEVKSCSKTCEEYYARLKKLYDEQRDKLGDASVETTAYTLALKKESDLEDTPVNDRYDEGMHAVPPPMTGNCMPSGPEVEIDYFKFIYGPKQTSVDESDSKLSEYASCESESSVDTTTSMPAPVENAPKVVCEPKVWIDDPIIEEYESDSDDDSMSNVQEDKEKPSFAFTDSVKHVKTSRENVKETGTPNHCPKVEKYDRNGHTRKGLGYAFTRKACFDDPHRALKDKGIVDSGCSRHMTGNKAHHADYQEFKGGSVAFGGSNGRITGKGKIKTGRLDFEDVYYVEELKHYNLFSVSKMCDNKNKVLFADIDCIVMSFDFKLPDENQVLLKIHRQNNMYSFNLKNIDPFGDLDCLFAKASIDESNKWHRRLCHVNFKNLNKLVKGNLVRGLPFKIFKNDHTCVACQKRKQHKASCKAKTCRPMREGENDMWVWGQGHMGRSGEGLGTVQVRWGCTGMAGEGVAILAGRVVKLLFG
nr:ribonuclease H-like domain-containing protein [Tanacetum cinerariifolium]